MNVLVVLGLAAIGESLERPPEASHAPSELFHLVLRDSILDMAEDE